MKKQTRNKTDSDEFQDASDSWTNLMIKVIFMYRLTYLGHMHEVIPHVVSNSHTDHRFTHITMTYHIICRVGTHVTGV